MELTTKNKVIISAVVVVTAFATGRYSVQAPTVKTQESIKTNDNKQTDTTTDTQQTTTVVKEPTGKETTTTVIDTKTTTEIKDKDTQVTQETQTVTSPKTNTLNVSALVGYSFSQTQPSYGVSVTKPLIGPITMGLWAATPGVAGVSVGLNF